MIHRDSTHLINYFEIENLASLIALILIRKTFFFQLFCIKIIINKIKRFKHRLVNIDYYNFSHLFCLNVQVNI